MDQINLSAWIDRREITTGGVDFATAQTARATLGGGPLREGDRLPALWHWCAFRPTAEMADLGPDGHPRPGDFLPPVRLNRRMWAGGALEFLRPLHVGERLTRETRIAGVSEKSGAAGDMVFVTLEHEIAGEAGLAIRERQDIVYLQIPERFRAPKPTAPFDADATEPVMISPPLLFRYSAITFNAHRIHYDLPYTQEVEHYPDLVVHGPLQATLLMDLATRHRGRAPSMFSFRGLHPVFASDTVALALQKASDAEWSLSTVANDTHQGMHARAIWEI
ncbi:MaoC family dehydratase N-terminal domain-containing protein [Sulfitobacter albidus]|uniref:MaoC family dehydratase N-terminal domain-containing protein n=1 Tax=Sulfitobacter albidus TaxID=2829501 RepID=A0A975PLI6_9RHOB|nr:MaoC family dehydratase N-terminal domain-containing protein [Sulfitobacter albidus]QUJ75724.1 MaoC family dehydratase N-terminal domain-containing protein [Sulfitobacter albidus]